MTRLFLALPIALALALAATASSCGGVCTLIALPGVTVTVVDSATNAPVEGDVIVVATHGPYADTAVVPPLLNGTRTAFLAEERAGFYRVEVRAPGYATWTSPLLHVVQEDCHVRTVAVTARLVKTAAN